MFSKTVICGNMGRKPQVNAAGTVARFSVAVSGRKKIDGAWADTTTWFDCAAFGKSVQALERFGDKGRTVICDGRIELVEFEKRDGTRGAKIEMACDSVRFVGRAPESSDSSDSAPAAAAYDDGSGIPF